MVLQGDLASIGLADVLQNVEAHNRTGTFRIEDDQNVSHVYVTDGQVSMLATNCRPALPEALVDMGLISEKDLDQARRSRRATKKSLGQVLVGRKVIDEATLREAAATYLSEDLANLLATAEGEFEFRQGPPPPRVFDRDEREMTLRLPVTPLLLEAARRTDDWAQIRKLIPTDRACYVALPRLTVPEESDEIDDLDLLVEVVNLLDGSRAVAQVTMHFPRRRFNVYKVLAYLVREHKVRAADSDDLVASAELIAETDPQRALEITHRGLESEPHHLGLLCQAAKLGEELGDIEAAGSAHKVIAQLHLEAEALDSASWHLEQAGRLLPRDPTVVERLMSVASQDDRKEDAVRHGLQLVELYRGPGLYQKAHDTLSELVAVDPNSLHLRRELARAQVDAGDPESAIQGLLAHARELLARAKDLEARQVYQEVLQIESTQPDASEAVEQIDSNVYARNRQRRKRLLRLAGVCLMGLLILTFVGIEGAARVASFRTERNVLRQGLIEKGEYPMAIRRWKAMAARHPFALATRLEVRYRVRELEALAKVTHAERMRQERERTRAEKRAAKTSPPGAGAEPLTEEPSIEELPAPAEEKATPPVKEKKTRP